jgi:hypothetical protein
MNSLTQNQKSRLYTYLVFLPYIPYLYPPNQAQCPNKRKT